MSIYHSIKSIFSQRIIRWNKKYKVFRSELSARRYMRALMKKHNLPQLSKDEINEAKEYYKRNGYKLKNTYWHRYYKGINGKFYKNYMPYDVFNARINPKLNREEHWPALLDKNFTYQLFKNFRQPKCIIQNINGIYYQNFEMVSLKKAIEACKIENTKFIIKPTIDTGSGKMVNTFEVKGNFTNYENYSLKALFELYNKDFIVQEYLEQEEVLKALNPSSLNTLRVVSYLNDQGVHILASVLRIGKLGSTTDNFSTGGLFCNVLSNGQLEGLGYNPKGESVTSSPTGIDLKTCQIPNFHLVKDMIRDMHFVVPYFKVISWDIGLNQDKQPYLIEYNTTRQGIDLQIASGPYLADFTDEILSLALES